MRKIAEHMGMPISIDIPMSKSPKIFSELFAICEDTDNRFSPYKPTSELSKLWRGEIKMTDVSQDMQHIIAECQRYEQLTDGYFSAYYDKRFNPTGYVKAWCLRRMVEYLASINIDTYLLNAGGDIVASSDSKYKWDIAIANPFNTTEPIAKLNVDNLCIATSGSYERGSHIIDPHTGQAATELASVTIFGPKIEPADVFATAVYAMGEEKGLKFIKTQKYYEAIMVRPNSSVITSAKAS